MDATLELAQRASIASAAARCAFTEAESEEARSLLAPEIPYSIEGDAFTMTVRGPMGEMEVVYKRQGE